VSQISAEPVRVHFEKFNDIVWLSIYDWTPNCSFLADWWKQRFTERHNGLKAVQNATEWPGVFIAAHQDLTLQWAAECNVLLEPSEDDAEFPFF
jgi:hypothetical protein